MWLTKSGDSPKLAANLFIRKSISMPRMAIYNNLEMLNNVGQCRCNDPASIACIKRCDSRQLSLNVTTPAIGGKERRSRPRHLGNRQLSARGIVQSCSQSRPSRQNGAAGCATDGLNRLDEYSVSR